VFILISVVLALLNDIFGIAAIAYMMGLSWGTLAGCFIGPYVLGLFWKKVSRSAVWTSIIGSLVLTVILTIVFGYDKAGWNCSFATAIQGGIGSSPLTGVICMIFSIVATFVVSLLTKAPDDSIIVNAFNEAKENTVVSQ
jgi:SSS family solute:Na+ symporter/sodium/proline symporter